MWALLHKHTIPFTCPPIKMTCLFPVHMSKMPEGNAFTLIRPIKHSTNKKNTKIYLKSGKYHLFSEVKTY